MVVELWTAVMCQSHFCHVRVTSPSSQIRVRVIKKFFESSLVMTWSSRVRVESQELSSHFESLVCKLESMSSQMKFHIFSMTSSCYEMAHNLLQNGARRGRKWCRTCYEMVPNKLKNGAQCSLNKLVCRLCISTFIQFAFELSLSLSVIPTSLVQPCCKCCKLSVSVLLNVRFTMNKMWVKNNTHICSANKQK